MTIIQQTYAISGAKEIILESWGEITLAQGDEDTMTIETEDSLLPKLKTEVSDGRLELGLKNKLEYIFHIKHFKHPPVKYHITVKAIEHLGISGSGNLRSETDLRAGELKLKISGSGEISLGKLNADGVEAGIAGSGQISVEDLQSGKLSFHVPGSGRGKFYGSAAEVEVSISGSGKLDAQSLQSETVQVKISGSGEARVNASRSLEARISGSGRIEYQGHPSVKSSVSGSGKVKSLE